MKANSFVIGLAAAALALGAQTVGAQPVRSCPPGQAVNSLEANGTPVTCLPIPDVGALQGQISAEAAARTAADSQLQTALAGEAAVRLGMDATLLASINDETEARKTAIQALQDSLSSPATRCYAAHFLRVSGTEVRFTVITFSNGDLQNPATIERITFRDPHGNVLSDTGPKVGVPHPLANAQVPPRDITVVPPGGSYALSTTDLWQFNPIPSVPGTDLISVQVEVSKAGKRSLFQVLAREIARDRVIGSNGLPTAGNERSANMAACFPVDPQS